MESCPIVCPWCERTFNPEDLANFTYITLSEKRITIYGQDFISNSSVCPNCYRIYRLGYREGHGEGCSQVRKEIRDALGIYDKPIHFNPEGLKP